MGSKANYLEDAIINHVLRATSFTSPGSNVWVALFTDSQGEADSGTEASGSAYARVRVQGTGAWDAPSNGATANTSTITFPTASGGNWGSIVSVGVYDDSVSGNLLYYADLNSPKTVNDGDTFTFAAGDLDISEA